MAILRLARKRLEISFEMKTCLVVKLFPSAIDNLVKRFCFQKHSMVWFTCFVRCVNQAVKQWDMRYSFSIHPFMYLLYLLSHYSTIMYFWHCLKLWHVAFLTTYNSVWLFLVVCSCRHLVIYANSSTLSFLFCIFLHVLVIKNIGLQVHLMDGDILQRKAKQSQPQYSIENCLNSHRPNFRLLDRNTQ